jgi:hypothetical protein
MTVGENTTLMARRCNVNKYTYGKYVKINIEADGPDDFFVKLSQAVEFSWLVNSDPYALKKRLVKHLELESDVDDTEAVFQELTSKGFITIWQ